MGELKDGAVVSQVTRSDEAIARSMMIKERVHTRNRAWSD